MRLEVDGRSYRHFLRSSVEVSVDSLARRFEFEAATRGVGDIPFRPGQSAAVYIDDERVLNGWVEKIEVGVSEGAREVTYVVSGRDRMADVVDSQVDGLGEFGSTVAAVASAVLRHLGVSASVVDRSTSARRPFASAGEIAKPEVGETAGDFLWGVAARRQVVLGSDGDANLVVSDGAPEVVAARLVNRVDGVGNNLVGFQFASDHSKRFHRYRVVSQSNVAALSWEQIGTSASAVATVRGEHVDAAIRPSRRRSLAGESTYASGDATTRARWEANLARASGLSYVARVPSWRDETGALWRVNTAPKVEDEFAGVASRMAITDLVFVDGEGGETTVLTLRPPEVYTAQAALTAMDRRAQLAKDARSDASAVSIDPALAAELEDMVLR